MDREMQHVLAAAITKILDQKSIRESVANLHQLVVDQLEDQVNQEKAQPSSLKMQASQKLLKSFKNEEDVESQKEMLQRSLSRSLSRGGLARGSDAGLRSTTLLQNYIEQNINNRSQRSIIGESVKGSHISASQHYSNVISSQIATGVRAIEGDVNDVQPATAQPRLGQGDFPERKAKNQQML